jgi:hypothetical protein
VLRVEPLAVKDAEAAIAYGNAWHDGATSAGMNDTGVYVGARVAPPLSESELFRALSFQRYWRSFSGVNNVRRRRRARMGGSEADGLDLLMAWR